MAALVLNIPKRLVLHCTDSLFGDVPTVAKWHLAKGWNGIGYHFLIENGYGRSTRVQDFNAQHDGAISRGRPETVVGAHAEGWNTGSLGICLVGKNGVYTPRQITVMFELLKVLCLKYTLSEKDLYGHYEVPSQLKLGTAAKKCPCLAMPAVRARLQAELAV